VERSPGCAHGRRSMFSQRPVHGCGLCGWDGLCGCALRTGAGVCAGLAQGGQPVRDVRAACPAKAAWQGRGLRALVRGPLAGAALAQGGRACACVRVWGAL